MKVSENPLIGTFRIKERDVLELDNRTRFNEESRGGRRREKLRDIVVSLIGLMTSASHFSKPCCSVFSTVIVMDENWIMLFLQGIIFFENVKKLNDEKSGFVTK